MLLSLGGRFQSTFMALPQLMAVSFTILGRNGTFELAGKQNVVYWEDK